MSSVQQIAPERAARAAARVIGWAAVLSAELVLTICLREAYLAFPRTRAMTVPMVGVGLAFVIMAAALVLVKDAQAEGKFWVQGVFLGRRSWIGSLLFGAVLVGTLAVVFEAAFYMLNSWYPPRPRPEVVFRPGNVVPAARYGYVSPPGIFCHKVRAVGTRRGFDTAYTIGEDGFRVTPQPRSAINGASLPDEGHALFFGCSFTFGEGCADEETLPAQFAALEPDYHVYNFASIGYGPAQCLSLLMYGRIEQAVMEDNGIAVYVFIEDHIRRAVGSMRRRNAWTRDFPRFSFSFDVKGNPTMLGSFQKAEPLRTAFYQCLGHEQYFEWADLDWPILVSEDDITYTANLIAAAKKVYCEKFGGRDFYMLLHPLSSSGDDVDRLIKLLDAKGVPILDYRRLIWGKPLDSCAFSDGHPTAYCNRIIGNRLAADLPTLVATGPIAEDGP